MTITSHLPSAGLGAFKQLGPLLIKGGYQIIPIARGYKYPKGLKNWESLNLNEANFHSFSKASVKQDSGVGVLTAYTPAVDIDIYDEQVAQTTMHIFHKHCGKTPVRIGLAPKMLLPYRTSTPFKKIVSKTYEDFLGQQHRIEVLGQSQQFVAYGTHPDTRKPYHWPNDGIEVHQHSDLPELKLENVKAAIEEFESNVPSDWTVVQQGSQFDSDIYINEQALINNKPPLDISEARLKKALSVINADDYQLWIKVGMALHHQFDGSGDGFHLWNKWASSSHKYHIDAQVEKWPSFKVNSDKTNPITAATILHLETLAAGKVLAAGKAPAAGKVKKSKSNKDLNVFESLSEKQSHWIPSQAGEIDTTSAVRRTHKTEIEKFLARYLYVERGDQVCDLHKPAHHCLSRLTEFKNRTANIRHEVPQPNQRDPNATKLQAVSTSWLVHPQRLSAQGRDYLPEQHERLVTDEHGLLWINDFHMPNFADTNDVSLLTPFFEHMTYLMPIKAEREWFIDWMAFNIQFPGERCLVTPLHYSRDHGTGRGWIVRLMNALLGPWNCTKTKMPTLCGEGSAGGFQDYLNRSLFCAIEEVRENNQRYGISDKVRDVLTEEYFEVNVKYGGKKTQRIYTNFFFMTNHIDALVLTDEDRRINVISGPDYFKSTAYYQSIYAWLKGKGVAQLNHFLVRRDLSNFDHARAMRTVGREKMIESNQNETEILFRDVLANPPCFAMTQEQLIKHMCLADGSRADSGLADGGFFEVNIKVGQVKKLLQENANGPHRLRINHNGQSTMKRAWIVDKEKIDASDEDIKASVIHAEELLQ